MSGKAACKAAIQEELGLEVRDDRPLMVMVTRLTRQKGMDLVTYSLERILAGGVQVAVLGTGDRDYEDALRWFENMYPGQMAARIQFDPALSQRMYAGADLFLMPSLFEPCGLSQMIAMRYGTLPVVRETGGLRDTVQPYNQYTGEGTGFSFAHFNGEEMGDAVFRAARLFWDDREAWNSLVAQAMSVDFSWKASAQRYLDLYLGLHPDCELEPKPASAPARKRTASKPKAATRTKAKPATAAETGPVAEAESAPKAAVETKPAQSADDTPKVAASSASKTSVSAKAAASKPKRTRATAKKPTTGTTTPRAATAATRTRAKSSTASAATTKTTAEKANKTAAGPAAKPTVKAATKPAAKPRVRKAGGTETKPSE